MDGRPTFPFSPFLLLVLLATPLFFARLDCPLQEPEEARYAEVPRQMLEAGRWLVPVLHGQPYLDKPPLLYWLVMGSYTLFGVGDGAARLPAALAALATVLATYGWGRRTIGVRAAFVGAVLLCLSGRFVYLGRLLTMNGLLALWVVAAWAAAHAALQENTVRWRWWLLSAGACGLGLLTKGPVALALVVPPVFVATWLDRRLARPGIVVWAVYGLVTVGMAAPWFGGAIAAEPEFAAYFFWKHNLERFVTPFDHQEPFWFYLPELALAVLPWAVVLALRFAFGTKPPHPQPLTLTSGMRGATFYLLAATWCVLFYSAAGCKRPGYLLPALPPLALALGQYLDSLLRAETIDARRWAHALTAAVLLLGLGGALAACGLGLLKLTEAVSLSAACLLVLAALLRFGHAWSAHRSWLVCGGTTFALLLTLVYLTLPGQARRFSLRGYLRPHQALLADRRVPVICYPRRWDSVSFYLRRSDVQACAPNDRVELIRRLQAEPETLLVVKSDHSLRDLLRDLPPSLTFRPTGRRDRVTVGLVRATREVPPSLMVGR